MGNLVGNVFGLLILAVTGLLGFVSFSVFAATFVALSYGFLGLFMIVNFAAGRAISDSLLRELSRPEIRAFRRYNIHIRGPGAGEIFSALLNIFRLVGLGVALALALTGGYALSVIYALFFFLSGSTILKLSPIRYMEKHAGHAANNPSVRSRWAFLVRELQAIDSVKSKRIFHLENSDE
jgi:hypothetical protein